MEPCFCGDRDCQDCYRQPEKVRYQDQEPEADDEYGRYDPPDRFPAGSSID